MADVVGDTQPVDTVELPNEDHAEQLSPPVMENVDLASSPATLPCTTESDGPQLAPGSMDSHGSDGAATADLADSLADTELQARQSVPMSTRLLNFKSWGVTRVKCARQAVNERLGKATRTVDVQMDERIETLREAQRNYQQIIVLAKRMSTQLRALLDTQRSLSDLFGEYGVRVTDNGLQTELLRNSASQKVIARNGEALIAALDHFVANINTLLTKTMEDTFKKVREYEAGRVQYDAYRIDAEQLQAFCDANPTNTVKQAKLEAALVQFEAQKSLFTILRNELTIKLKFLDENKVKKKDFKWLRK